MKDEKGTNISKTFKVHFITLDHGKVHSSGLTCLLFLATQGPSLERGDVNQQAKLRFSVYTIIFGLTSVVVWLSRGEDKFR